MKTLSERRCSLGRMLGLILSFLLLGIAQQASAFTLLGPYADWMTETIGYRATDDIGGPMNINEEYRWNVPVLTYGFDDSFINYFGSNGVAAVESAIQILNDLPPASLITPADYPFDSRAVNSAAQAQGLCDLKSHALFLLVEHLGLAQPTRYVLTFRQWDEAHWQYYSTNTRSFYFTNFMPEYIIQRNFDPETFEPTYQVNADYCWSANITKYLDPTVWIIHSQAINLSPQASAVADGITSLYQNSDSGYGTYFTGLTADDVGGLRYLLSSNNFNFELLLPGVRSAGNANSYVNAAVRPGVEKITLVPHVRDPLSGRFVTMTNQYTDTCVTNGVLLHQQVERAVDQPDFLFTVDDFFNTGFLQSRYSRSGTTNWINCAESNGNVGGAGPGIIQPPVRIAFHRIGSYAQTDEMWEGREYWSSFRTQHWASFDAATNLIVYTPVDGDANWRLQLVDVSTGKARYRHIINWTLPGSTATVALQCSDNLTNWTTAVTAPSNTGTFDWFYYNATKTQKFFRVVPQ